MDFLATASLLVVDKVGYLPIGQYGTNLFFQLINRRYKRNATLLTSDKSFRQWGEIFGEIAADAAILDRLLHHCNLVQIAGNSYRLWGTPIWRCRRIAHWSWPHNGEDLGIHARRKGHIEMMSAICLQRVGHFQLGKVRQMGRGMWDIFNRGRHLSFSTASPAPAFRCNISLDKQ
jgi:hypothetical protein